MKELYYSLTRANRRRVRDAWCKLTKLKRGAFYRALNDTTHEHATSLYAMLRNRNTIQERELRRMSGETVEGPSDD